MMVILTGVQRYFIVVLICTQLIISDIENVFMCLLATCMYYLEKCVCRPSAHFFDWVICLFFFLTQPHEMFVNLGY